jgi:serine/threonine protein kinase/tetratricopeptide (TPR) repeat protein
MESPMNARRVAEIADEVRGLTGSARETRLDMACAGDTALRDAVERKLRGLLDDATIDAPVEAPRTPTPIARVDRAVGGEEIGQEIGPYKLLERLGEGGFGTVYLAQQEAPVRRRVALKIIKLGMDTRQVIARFEAERQALAMMDHAGIARVLDAGATTTGRPFFVMELVRGIPVTEYCERHNLDAKARLELFIEICHAVQHAHQKGVIHRDLKPSNILVAEQDDKPLAKVIDFGIAKATSARLGSQTVYTQQRQLIGTPAYMSPEQADMSGLDIDTRSDIYSLGVILYELLTGAVPVDDNTLQHATFDEVSRILREFEPSRPSTVVRKKGDTSTSAGRRRSENAAHMARALKGDLDWIIMKAIEKDRARRYETANALAMDIERHLRNEPVLAGPPNPLYKFGKFARRNRVGLAAASVVFLALVGGLTAAAVGFRRASIERDNAVTARVEAEQARDESEAVTSFLVNMLAAVDPGNDGRDVAVRDVLDVAAASIGSGLTDSPLVEARLRDTIGRTYLELGLLDRAERQLPIAYETRRVQLGADADETLASLNALARLDAERGDFATARRRIEESLNLAGDLDGARALEATFQLAGVDFLQGRYESAAAGFRRALEGRRALLGADDQATLQAARGLARVHRAEGKWPEAIGLTEETLATQERTLGADHPETIRTLGELAWLALRTGDRERADTLYRRALDAGERVLGANHPTTLGLAVDYAQALTDAGAYDQAGELLDAQIGPLREALGDDHPNTLRALAALGQVRRRQGRIDEADGLLTEALRLQERALGGEHPSTLLTLVNLANIRLSQGRAADAEPLLVRALAGQRTTLGEEHIDTIATRITLATVYSSTDRLDEAERMYRAAIEASDRSLGPDGRPGAVARVNLAILLRNEGRYTEAESLYTEAIDSFERTLGESHPQRLRTMNNLAELLAAMGRVDDAVALHERTLGLRLASPSIGPAHPDTAVSFDNLARLHEQSQRWDALAALLERRADAAGGGLASLEHLAASADAWVRAGDMSRARGPLGRLLGLLREAAAAPDADPALLIGAAWTFLHCEPADMQDPGAALEIARRAVEATQRRDLDALGLFADAQLRTDDAAGAAATLREAISAAPDDDPRAADLRARLAEAESRLQTD